MSTPTKACFKCGTEKPLHDFYRHSRMADGHVNKCKECNKKDVRENRRMRLDYYRKYDKKRYMESDERKASCCKYVKDHPEKAREYKRKWEKLNPEKKKAQNTVNNAVRDGKLIKPDTCQECGSSGIIHGHHDDYRKPLDVRWLCAACHFAWHAEHGEGKL